MGLPRLATDADRQWQARADSLAFDALPRLRTAAEKWAGTIGSLTGLLGIVAFVKGPEDIAELTPVFRIAVAACLLAAVLAAAAATVLAALVAQGVPKTAWSAGMSVRDLYRTETEAAVKNLGWSRGLAVAATVLLIAAVGLNWFGERPAAAASAPAVVVVRSSGTVACGRLAMDAAGNTLLSVGGTPGPLADVVSLDPVAACPQ